MYLKRLLLTYISISITLAALNEPCIGKGGAQGVCIKTSDCSAESGTNITGACPSDPSDVRCCTKPTCNSGTSGGNCRWQSDCSSSSVSNQCPGPSAFKCCKSNSNGFGGYKTPSFPTPGTSCKAVAVSGAKKVVAKFPGRVREIGCTRNCACNSNPSSDHCCGKAVDFMCSDSGGTPTMSGKEIAEWVMRNCESLKCKYVIWGQKIWNSGTSVKGWSAWKDMEDRGSITQNHWYGSFVEPVEDTDAD